jgi:hypothetical protein
MITERQVLMLQDFKQMYDQLIKEFDAIDVFYSVLNKRVEIHMRDKNFVKQFDDFDIQKKDRSEFPFVFSVDIEGFHFFALSRTLPEKEKPQEGAEVIHQPDYTIIEGRKANEHYVQG